ncbi:MAG: hypothetical protein QM820_39010 [Minicystis sp.]
MFSVRASEANWAYMVIASLAWSIKVNPEPDEAGDARQVGIGRARADRRRVRAPHPLASLIAIATLASRRLPPHLGGARRSLASFHRKNRCGECRAYFLGG